MLLQTVTTQFDAQQDRLRLSAHDGRGATVVIWLSRRMLAVMLPTLLSWLDRQTSDPIMAELVHGFEQQRAKADLVPQAPVQTMQGSAQWLAIAVDIGKSRDKISLGFRGADDQCATMELDARALRQWLGMVHQAWQKADWSSDVWPQWVHESASAVNKPVILH